MALGQIELQRRQRASAVVAQGSQRIEFAVVAGGDDGAVVQAGGDGIGQRGGQQVQQRGIHVQGLSRSAQGCGQVVAGVQCRGDRERRGLAVAQGGEVARGAAAERQAAERAGHVGRLPQGGAHPRPAPWAR